MAAPSPISEVEARPYRSSFEHLRDELARLDVLVRGQVARARQAAAGDAWRGLAISEAEVDALLERSLGEPPWNIAEIGPSLADAQALADRIALAIERRLARSTVPSRLVQLAERFGLDRFTLDIVIIALAPELDLRYERLYAYLHDDLTRKRPSVDLALHLLCRALDERFAGRARFDASAPLVKHGLVQLVSEQASPPLLARALKLDDRIVDWLHGSDRLDARLLRHARRIEPSRHLDELLLEPGVRDRLAASSDAALVYLQGPAGIGKCTVAEAFAHDLQRNLLAFDAATLDGIADDAAASLVRAAAREAQLTGDLLLVEHADLLLAGERPQARAAVIDVLATQPGPCVLAAETTWEPGPALRGRPFVRVELPLPDATGQEQLWHIALANAPLSADVSLAHLAATLRLTAGQIHDAAASARSLARFRGAPAIASTDLEEGCRRQSGQRFGSLARRIANRPTWDALVLPGDRTARLREICDHARHRATVFEQWGFERKLASGKGLGILFVGAPGTGKTLAASVMATELGRDLFRIDLASVVSKWIGETEKHLGRVFDEAERGNGILLFDEADALFGKRSEIHDAHDRYANLETSYLLQRIEDYDGIVILTSNFRSNLDDAFVRRLRFIIEFPLPDEQERLRIWETIWPANTPRATDVDLPSMAGRFDLAGAHIRNIALAAAFLAAAEDTPIGQRHLLHATRREYQKLGKMVDEAQFRVRT